MEKEKDAERQRHKQMVDRGRETQMEIELLMKADMQQKAGKIDNLKGELLKKSFEFIKPLSEKMEQMNITL